MSEYKNHEILYKVKNKNGWNAGSVKSASQKLPQYFLKKYDIVDYKILGSNSAKTALIDDKTEFTTEPWWLYLTVFEKGNILYSKENDAFFIYPDENVPIPTQEVIENEELIIEVDEPEKYGENLSFSIDIDCFDWGFINFVYENNIQQIKDFLYALENNDFAYFTAHGIDLELTCDTYHKILVWLKDDYAILQIQNYDMIEHGKDNKPINLCTAKAGKNELINKFKQAFLTVEQLYKKYKEIK